MIDYIIEQYPEEEFLKADGFDEAILGVDEKTMRLIYSVKKCIEILMKDGMTYEEAYEYFEYNTAGAYVGEKTPIWCQNDFDTEDFQIKDDEKTNEEPPEEENKVCM